MPAGEIPASLEFCAWLAELVRQNRMRLVRLARSEGLRGEDALDVVQDAFITFIQTPRWREVPRHGDDAAHLLAAVVRNAARNARRKAARQEKLMDTEPEVLALRSAQRELDELLEEAREHLRLSGCLATLKELHRDVVVARMFDGASGHDVAAELGLTPGHVAVILHRAKESLRQCLLSSRQALGLPHPH